MIGALLRANNQSMRHGVRRLFPTKYGRWRKPGKMWFWNLSKLKNVTVLDEEGDMHVDITGTDLAKNYQGQLVKISYETKVRRIHVFGWNGFIFDSKVKAEQDVVNELRAIAKKALNHWVKGKGGFKEGMATGSKTQYDHEYDTHISDTVVIIRFCSKNKIFEEIETRIATSKTEPNWQFHNLSFFKKNGLLPVHINSFPDELKRKQGTKTRAVVPYCVPRKVQETELPTPGGKGTEVFRSLETEKVSKLIYDDVEGGTPNSGTCALVNATYHKTKSPPDYCFSSGEFQPVKGEMSAFKEVLDLSGEHTDLFGNVIMHSCFLCKRSGNLAVDNAPQKDEKKKSKKVKKGGKLKAGKLKYKAVGKKVKKKLK